jgi:hypothetical protein
MRSVCALGLSSRHHNDNDARLGRPAGLGCDSSSTSTLSRSRSAYRNESTSSTPNINEASDNATAVNQ